MFPAYPQVTAVNHSAFSQKKDMPFFGAPAEIHFEPGFSNEMMNFCHSVNEETEMFFNAYNKLNIQLRRYSGVSDSAGHNDPDCSTKTQTIVVHVPNDFDIHCPLASARALYTLMHELFSHAAPFSWHFSNIQNGSKPSNGNFQAITHQHHMNNFLPADRSNEYHRLIAKTAQRFKFEPARIAFLRSYVEDIRLDLIKLIEHGVLTKDQIKQAWAWHAQLLEKVDQPFSPFWLP